MGELYRWHLILLTTTLYLAFSLFFQKLCDEFLFHQRKNRLKILKPDVCIDRKPLPFQLIRPSIALIFPCSVLPFLPDNLLFWFITLSFLRITLLSRSIAILPRYRAVSCLFINLLFWYRTLPFRCRTLLLRSITISPQHSTVPFLHSTILQWLIRLSLQ